MLEIAGARPVERAAGGPSPIETGQAARPQGADSGPRESRLEPAVSVEVRPDAQPAEGDRKAAGDYRGRYVKDLDSQEIVYQVVDPGSGTVMVQLPSPQALDARAYAQRAAAARAAQSEAKEAVNRMA